MSKQRVFKLSYLPRGKDPNKNLAHYISFKNMTAICWSPPPAVCWQVEVRAFLLFLIFWFVERAGNTVISNARLVGEHVNHRVIAFEAGPRLHFRFSAKERAGSVALLFGRVRTPAKNDIELKSTKRFDTHLRKCPVQLSPRVSVETVEISVNRV